MVEIKRDREYVCREKEIEGVCIERERLCVDIERVCVCREREREIAGVYVCRVRKCLFREKENERVCMSTSITIEIESV